MRSAPAIDIYADLLGEMPPGALIQVVYSSLALVGPEADQAILGVSQRNNQAVEVTGLLVRDGDWFLQVLEGPADVVPAVMRRIESDTRHRDVRIRLVKQVDRRRFGDWTMCSPSLDRAGFEALVASLDAEHGETDRLVAEFINDGAWPSRFAPRRRLSAALRAAIEDASQGIVRYRACASLLRDGVGSAGLETLVDDWWHISASHGVTGFLIHSDGNLLHYVEGGAAAVEASLRSIGLDARHDGVVTLLEGETDKRLFPDCPLDLRGSDRPLFPDAGPGGGNAELRRALGSLVRGMR